MPLTGNPSHDIPTELAAGKPRKQAIAIALSEQREHAHDDDLDEIVKMLNAGVTLSEMERKLGKKGPEFEAVFKKAIKDPRYSYAGKLRDDAEEKVRVTTWTPGGRRETKTFNSSAEADAWKKKVRPNLNKTYGQEGKDWEFSTSFTRGDSDMDAHLDPGSREDADNKKEYTVSKSEADKLWRGNNYKGGTVEYIFERDGKWIVQVKEGRGDAEKDACPKCEGSGKIIIRKGNYRTGYTRSSKPCPECNGKGKLRGDAGSRKYYTLLDPDGHQQFGDYSKGVVQQELRDQAESDGKPRNKYKIVESGDSQQEINAAVVAAGGRAFGGRSDAKSKAERAGISDDRLIQLAAIAHKDGDSLEDIIQEFVDDYEIDPVKARRLADAGVKRVRIDAKGEPCPKCDGTGRLQGGDRCLRCMGTGVQGAADAQDANGDMATWIKAVKDLRTAGKSISDIQHFLITYYKLTYDQVGDILKKARGDSPSTGTLMDILRGDSERRAKTVDALVEASYNVTKKAAKLFDRKA